MQRLATSVAIAAWIGFLGLFSLEVALDALAPELLEAASRTSWPPAMAAQFGGIAALLQSLAPPLELGIAAVCLAIVALFARGLVLIHGPHRDGIRRGERLAAFGLGGIAALAGAAQATAVPLLPIDLQGGLVWLALGLSAAALAFDRLVAIETEEEAREDAEFQAGLSRLAGSMGRQARRYPLQDGLSAHGRWPDVTWPGPHSSGPDSTPGKEHKP